MRELQEATVGESLPPTIANLRLQSTSLQEQPHLQEQTPSDSSWSATRRLCLHKAIQLTATIVGGRDECLLRVNTTPDECRQ